MDNVLRLVDLLSAGMTVVGAMIVISALYKMFSERANDRPVQSGEWWKIAEGTLLAVVGESNFLHQLIAGLQF